MTSNFETEPIGVATDGVDVYLQRLWPSAQEVSDTIAASVRAGAIPPRPMRTSSPATRRGVAARPGRRSLRVATGLDLRAPPAVIFERMAK